MHRVIQIHSEELSAYEEAVGNIPLGQTVEVEMQEIVARQVPTGTFFEHKQISERKEEKKTDGCRCIIL